MTSHPVLKQETSSAPDLDHYSPKKNRLDDVINKLKDKVDSEHNICSLEEKAKTDSEIVTKNPTVDIEEIMQTEIDEDSNNTVHEDSLLTKSYLMWENNSNVCWLDASMSLLAHNRLVLKAIDKKSSTHIQNIVQYYHEAIDLLNDYSSLSNINVRLRTARGMLESIQETSLEYLQPILKYKDGEPDSAFCSLINLIAEDKRITKLFYVEFSWVLRCHKCNFYRVKKNKKNIITMSNVKEFLPDSPLSICQCPACKAPGQKMILKYKSLSQCLIFHFENGAGVGELQSLDFELGDRKYHMTGVMVLEKGKETTLNHFVTWIRDPATDSWLECNDLNSDILSFSVVPPFIELKDVYIMMFEAVENGKTKLNWPLIVETGDKSFSEEEGEGSSTDIPLIDLVEDVAVSSETKKEVSSLLEGEKKVPVSLEEKEVSGSLEGQKEVADSLEKTTETRPSVQDEISHKAQNNISVKQKNTMITEKLSIQKESLTPDPAEIISSRSEIIPKSTSVDIVHVAHVPLKNVEVRLKRLEEHEITKFLKIDPHHHSTEIPEEVKQQNSIDIDTVLQQKPCLPVIPKSNKLNTNIPGKILEVEINVDCINSKISDSESSVSKGVPEHPILTNSPEDYKIQFNSPKSPVVQRTTTVKKRKKILKNGSTVSKKQKGRVFSTSPKEFKIQSDFKSKTSPKISMVKTTSRTLETEKISTKNVENMSQKRKKSDFSTSSDEYTDLPFKTASKTSVYEHSRKSPKKSNNYIETIGTVSRKQKNKKNFTLPEESKVRSDLSIKITPEISMDEHTSKTPDKGNNSMECVGIVSQKQKKWAFSTSPKEFKIQSDLPNKVTSEISVDEHTSKTPEDPSEEGKNSLECVETVSQKRKKQAFSTSPEKSKIHSNLPNNITPEISMNEHTSKTPENSFENIGTMSKRLRNGAHSTSFKKSKTQTDSPTSTTSKIPLCQQTKTRRNRKDFIPNVGTVLEKQKERDPSTSYERSRVKSESPNTVHLNQESSEKRRCSKDCDCSNMNFNEHLHIVVNNIVGSLVNFYGIADRLRKN